jgi:hypothetical protein
LDIILVSDSVFALWDENIRSSPACFVPLSWIPAVNFKKYKTKHNQILASWEWVCDFSILWWFWNKIEISHVHSHLLHMHGKFLYSSNIHTNLMCKLRFINWNSFQIRNIIEVCWPNELLCYFELIFKFHIQVK